MIALPLGYAEKIPLQVCPIATNAIYSGGK
jgi:hypothetical protein